MTTSLLQSPLWKRVQEADRRRVFYIKNCLIIKYALPFRKSWLYSPHPAIADEKQFKTLIPSITQLAKKEAAIFLKIEGIHELRITHFPPARRVRAGELLITNKTIKKNNSNAIIRNS